MKKLLIGAGIGATLLVGAFVVIPWFAHAVFDKETDRFVTLMKQTYGDAVTVERNESSWLGREFDVRIGFAAILPTEVDIPDLVFKISSAFGPVTHHPECGFGLGAAATHVTVDFAFDELMRTRLLDDLPLMTGCSQTGFDGRERGSIALNSVDGEITDGVHLRIPEMTATAFIENGASTFEYSLPEMEMTFADGSVLRMAGLAGTGFTSDHLSVLPSLSENDAKIGSIAFEGPNFSGSLNDVVIEARGEIIDRLYSATVDSRVREARFADVLVTDVRYAVSATRLEASAFEKVMAGINATNAAGKDAALAADAFEVLQAELLKLIPSSPMVSLDEFGFSVDGERFVVQFNAQLDGEGFVSPTETPLGNRLSAKLNVASQPGVAKRIAAAIVRPQIAAQLEAQGAAEAQDPEAIAALAAQQADMLLANLQANGIVQVDADGRYRSDVTAKSGQVTMNGAPQPALTQMLQQPAP